MKSISKKLIMILKIVLDVAWYVAMVLAIIAALPLFYEIFFNKYAEWIAQVTVSEHDLISKVSSSEIIKFEYLKPEQADLSFRIKNTLPVRFGNFLITYSMGALVLSIIYNVRKLFTSLNMGQAFSDENVAHLRRVALLVAFILPWQLLLYLFELYLVRPNFSDMHPIEVIPLFDLTYITIAAVIYILAEIFNYGLELKRENDEFV